MPHFNESQLEQSIIALLQEQGYDYANGEDIVRNFDEVVLHDDLATYLRNRYRNDGITETEIEAAIRVITQLQGGILYEENKQLESIFDTIFIIHKENMKLIELKSLLLAKMGN